MRDDRYAPPVAVVADVLPAQPAIERPRQIVLAVQLAAIGYVLGLAVLVVAWDYYSKLQPNGAVLFNQVFALAISVWLYGKVYAGRNWARIVLLVLAIVGMAFTFNQTFVTLLKAAPLIAKVQMVVGIGTNVAILWLLFLSPGREWFKKRAGNVAA